jgi:hypothetical protein
MLIPCSAKIEVVMLIVALMLREVVKPRRTTTNRRKKTRNRFLREIPAGGEGGFGESFELTVGFFTVMALV